MVCRFDAHDTLPSIIVPTALLSLRAQNYSIGQDAHGVTVWHARTREEAPRAFFGAYLGSGWTEHAFSDVYTHAVTYSNLDLCLVVVFHEGITTVYECPTPTHHGDVLRRLLGLRH